MPGSPKPKRDVRVVLTVPFVEVVFSKNNPVQEEVVGNQTHLPHFYGRVVNTGIGIGLQNRKCGSDSHLALQFARWGSSSMGLERRIPKPKGGSSSLPCPTKRFQWGFVKQTTIALSMALWSKRSLASLSRRRRRSVTGQSCHFKCGCRQIGYSHQVFILEFEGSIPFTHAIYEPDGELNPVCLMLQRQPYIVKEIQNTQSFNARCGTLCLTMSRQPRVMLIAKVHTRNTMGYIEKSWEVPRWLLAQRLFRRKVGQLSVGWFMLQLAMSLCWHFSP